MRVDLLNGAPINLNDVKFHQLNNKFDVDIFEVVKRIASRIAKQDMSEELDSGSNNSENAQLQFPMIASANNLNVYTCSTTALTPSSSSSPPCSVDFRHTPSTSSSLFNTSDTSGYSTNDNSGNFTASTSNLSPVCVNDEEDVKKSEESIIDEDRRGAEKKSSLSKSGSATSLQLLAALASNNYNKEEKPLEIFIPLASCSDGDESLSPAQTIKSEKLLSPATSTTHRHGPKHRASRQSTHDDEPHTHTTKQLKMHAGIEACKRRMYKYIANNMYTTQIVQHYQKPLLNEKSACDASECVKGVNETKTNVNEQFNTGIPQPLNLYPDGDEYVTKEVKMRRNSKKQTIRVGEFILINLFFL
jgi:hypothetical protein